MKYIGRMITKLLINNGFVDVEDKADIQSEFDASFEFSETSENSVIKFLNALMKHPVGVLLSLWGYVKISVMVRRETMLEANESMEDAFMQQYKAKIFQDMLNDK